MISKKNNIEKKCERLKRFAFFYSTVNEKVIDLEFI
jgi:hypothetical protein